MNKDNNTDLHSRLLYIDYVRGLAMVLVIAGHVNFGHIFSNFIHLFHIPIFYYISGYLFNGLKQISFQSFISKKINSLIIPYLFFGICHVLLFYILVKIGFYTFPKHSWYYYLFLLNTSDCQIMGIQWFLTSFFWMHIFIFFIYKISKAFIKYSIIILLTTIGIYYQSFLYHQLPLALGSSLVGIGLFALGNIYRKFEPRFSRKHCIAILFIITLYLYLFIQYGITINMRTENYMRGGCLIFTVFFCAYLVHFTKMIETKFNKDNPILKEIAFIGKNSIVYLCLNEINIIVYKHLFDLVKIPIFFNRILVLIFTLITLHYLTCVFNNTPLRMVLGKFEFKK